MPYIKILYGFILDILELVGLDFPFLSWVSSIQRLKTRGQVNRQRNRWSWFLWWFFTPWLEIDLPSWKEESQEKFQILLLKTQESTLTRVNWGAAWKSSDRNCFRTQNIFTRLAMIWIISIFLIYRDHFLNGDQCYIWVFKVDQMFSFLTSKFLNAI